MRELGISFRSEPQVIGVIRETARTYGLQTDFIGVYDDLGDQPPIIPLYEAACNLPKNATTRLGAVGFAIPKYPSMVDIAGYVSTLNAVITNPDRIVTGLVPAAWMDSIGLRDATVQQMREAVESLRYLLAHETDGYQGNHYTIRPGFALNYQTPTNIPILLGAWGEKMGALAGELADEVKVGGSANPLMVDIMKERISVGAKKIGRNPRDINIALGAVTIVDEDGEKARYFAKRKAVMYIDVVGDKDPTALSEFPDEIRAIQESVRNGDIEEAVRHLPDELARRFVIAGTPADVIQHTRAMFEAGASRVEFGTPHGVDNTVEGELQGIQLLVEEVFPYFR